MHRHRRRGFTFTETLVALVVLLIGVVGVMKVLPVSLRGSFDASMRAKAAMLAQKKVEELRRDSTLSNDYISSIAAMTTPTPPVPFPEDDRLTYSFCGRSVIDPSSGGGVATPRVIVRYAQDFRAGTEVLYELRFLAPVNTP